MLKVKRIIAVFAMLAVTLGAGMTTTACWKNSGEDSGEVYKMQLYFANAEYIDSGDETLGHLSGPIELNISSDDKEGYDKYRLLLECMKETSEEDLNGAVNMLNDEIQFGDVGFNDGVATVDIKSETASGEPLYGGTLEELLLIEQITFSMIDSFEEVKAVAFTVDGSAADTLMGQMDISEPFDKESFNGDTL
ncbi:MAG: GerMN domain-containing protein [Clostridiales Family XIII bacterium]|nr:GerMN domain-containing protein [Clostridiales Family XIII bacterium]